MRLAIISDIHGNLTALEAVLAEIAQQKIDHIICLGDVASLGPQPLQVLARLQELNCPVVMGNTDDWLLHADLILQEMGGPSQRGSEIGLWGAQQLSETDKAYIRTFQPTITQPLSNGKTLLAYHGSPRSYNERILPTTPDEDLEQAFAGHTAHILIGGHTHIQMFRRYKDMLVLNPGSVGLAIDRVAPSPFGRANNIPWAEYAIITTEGNALNVKLRRTPFDIHAFIKAAHDSGMPHVEWFTSEWSLT